VTRATAALALAFAPGCLGPLVDDTPAPSGDIVAAGTAVPPIDSVADEAAQLAAHQFVPDVVPLRSAFAAGAPTRAWDFGPAPAFAAPMFVLATRAADNSLQPLAHPPIVGAIPGDAVYSPFWSLFALVVTDRYSGELITSAGAIDEAVRDGLVEQPTPLMRAVDRPLVAGVVRLDVGGGATIAPTGVVYYEHLAVAYFDFGDVPLAALTTIPIAPRYVLAREGEPPLSEPIRGVDLDANGNIVDTNDIYERAASDPLRSPLCRTVNVVVPMTVASIDTSLNANVADLKDAAQLFDPDPVAGTVLAVSSTDDLRDMPQQRQAGAL
jgi:hypothetical protein